LSYYSLGNVTELILTLHVTSKHFHYIHVFPASIHYTISI